MVTRLEVESLPLVSSSNSRHRFNDDGSVQKQHAPPTGHWYHAVFHTITAVVGAGVLGLPYAIASLGLAGGMTALAVACVVSLYCSYLLASLHQINGRRYNSYRELGEGILGPVRGFWAVVPFQYSVMLGLGVAYIVAAGEIMDNMYGSMCSSSSSSCTRVPMPVWMFVFAVMEMFLSQLPDLHSLWWVSLIGGAMSIGYSTIAFATSMHIASGRGAAMDAAAAADGEGARRQLAEIWLPVVGQQQQLAEWQSQHLWLSGSPLQQLQLRGGSMGRALLEAAGAASGAAGRSIYEVFNALGMVSFAYGGQLVQLEIQATLAPHPSPKWEMMKALLVSYAIVIVAYFGVASAGYAAFGAAVDADVLLSITGMGLWVDVADLMVVVHVAASYQVFSMPVFEAIEAALHARGWLVRKDARLTKLVARSAYCLMSWAIAASVPFFGELMGVIGAVGFTPMSFILPSLLWIMHHRHWGSPDCWANMCIIVVFTAVGLLAAVAAMHNLVL